jgi:sulfur-oxidizing protein SoxZ
MQSKMRAELKDGFTAVAVLISHPMETGSRKDPVTGLTVPRHFIEEIRCDHRGETILSADWGWGISTNPLLIFQFAGGAAGEPVTVHWRDNLGNSETIEARIG